LSIDVLGGCAVPVNASGSTRDQLLDLAIADRDRLISRDVLVGDPRRWRPRWFDGRFLAASDLQAEQNYFLVRQADLGRAGGSGVVDGLLVSEFADATGGERLRIDPGQGVTDTGELVVLFDTLTVNPADIPEMQRLDAAFGLQVIPNEPGQTRTGLYILALRPVEWTANPVGAYPTSLTGTRKIEDSTIVEGVAVSLIPYPQQSAADGSVRRRASLAREIFVEGRDRGLTSGVLPLAVVALRGNLVDWVDPFLVRRETGAERPAGMDFGFGARALREAHLLQYQQHLADAINASGDQPFVATSYFDALPPAGQFPAGTLDATRLTQRYFPPGIDVELSFIPEDELAAVIGESLLVPPIDLTLPADALAGTTVIVLVPLSRERFRENRASLPNWDATLPQLQPVFTGLRSLATPRQLLLSRFFPRIPTPAADAEDEQDEQAWRALLRTALDGRLLWYVRRRHLPIPTNIAGTAVAADHPSIADPRALTTLISTDASLGERIQRLRTINTPEVATLTSRLAERRFIDNPELLRSIVARAAGSEGSTPSPAVAVAALATTTDPSLGQGLALLGAESGALTRTLKSDRIVESGALPDIDRLARDVPSERLPELATELRSAVKTGENIQTNLTDLRRRFVPTP
jgi:hypothetical protein